MGALDGKTAIVTGAGRGIGRAIAEEFAKEGAAVVVASRTGSTVSEVVQGIEKAGGVALGLTCDVSRAEDLAAVVEKTIAKFGRIDILVNNAQGFGTKEKPLAAGIRGPFEETDEDEWNWSFQTGALATLRLMKLAFPYLKQRGGKVINFGSHSGVMALAGTVSYNSNKEAIRTLSKTAAHEWGRYGINVNVINPMLQTDATRAFYESNAGSKDYHISGTPMARVGEPVEAARMAVFLAGPDSDFVTGMTMYVDGGFTMN